MPVIDAFDGALMRMGHVDPAIATYAPKFLVVSPPRTATTWLAANLQCHPEIFIPPGKELHYFNLFYRRFDINWYLAHFAPSNGRVAGEVTPCSALPRGLIQAIHHFFPDLKLVFLLREPRSHAWSCLQHRARTGALDAGTASPLEVHHSAIVRYLADAGNITTSDFAWSLSQWLSVFHPSQVYVDFYETVARDPRGLLSRVFTHIGVDADVDWSCFPTHEVIHGSSGGTLPEGEVQRFLDAAYASKAKSLRDLLKSTFGLECPPEWQPILEMADPEPLVLGDYQGLAVYVHQGEFLASRRSARTQEPLYRAADLDSLEHMIDTGSFQLDRMSYLTQVHYREADRFFGQPAGVLGRADGHWFVHCRGAYFAFEEALTERPAEVTHDQLLQWVREDRGATTETVDELYATCRHKLVAESVHGCNIVRFRNRYYAVRQEVGPFAVTATHAEWIRANREAGVLDVADTLDDAIRAAAHLSERHSGSHAAPGPRFLHDGYKRFNVIAVGMSVCGLRRDLGAVDLADESLPWQAWEADGLAVLRDSEDEVLAWIDTR